MSGLTRSEISRRTGISDKSLCEYYHGKWEPRWHNYSLIYDAVRKELTDGKKQTEA
jgi:predicted transcriptional regulator